MHIYYMKEDNLQKAIYCARNDYSKSKEISDCQGFEERGGGIFRAVKLFCIL